MPFPYVYIHSVSSVLYVYIHSVISVPLENRKAQEDHQGNRSILYCHSSLLPIAPFLVPVILHYQTLNTTTKANHLSILSRMAASLLKFALSSVCDYVAPAKDVIRDKHFNMSRHISILL